MNMKRFTARSPREALALVRQTFGADAVVLSTRPCPEGVEVLAMAPDGMQDIERASSGASSVHQTLPAAAPKALAAPAAAGQGSVRVERVLDEASSVQDDVSQLQMSTLSFQDYVRQRMLKRREQELGAPREPNAAAAVPTTQRLQANVHKESPAAASAPASVSSGPAAPPASVRPGSLKAAMQALAGQAPAPVDTALGQYTGSVAALSAHAGAATASPIDTPSLEELFALGGARGASAAAAPAAAGVALTPELMRELREVKGLIETRFGALAFMEKLQRDPRQAQLTQRLLDAGFSPALARKLVAGLPADADEMPWASGVLERNLLGAEAEAPLEERSGVFALTGPTGVGKTTSTAKLAAAFAAQHGASQLGLVTLDAYRVGAQEQLRTYGRILGVPVHTAHDRASLEDLLDLLSAKRLVLIDTAGMAQRDARTRELLDMLSHRSVQRLLVLNAAAQGETIEDVLLSYRAATCAGVVLSKVDEAVKLGPALDAVIRHKLRVLAVANGQRVPEDWHRLSAHSLVQRALRAPAASAWRLDAGEVSLLMAQAPAPAAAPQRAAA